MSQINKEENAKDTLSKDQYNKIFQDHFNSLNTAQQAAVKKTEGPVMVIAGPGTGKTQLLAARIGNILRVTDARPYNILCLTYTEAGSIAMRQRLLEFIGPEAYRVSIFTFHAFCNDIIQRNPDYFGHRELEPISELENIELLRKLIDSLEANNPLKRKGRDLYFEVPRMQGLYQKMKEEIQWTPEHISNQIDAYLADLPNREKFIYKRAIHKRGIKVGDVKQNDIDKETKKMGFLKAAAALFPKYKAMMKELKRYDYNDMILWVLEKFRSDEDFLRVYQERYLYFLVDEYQDTNGSQNEILNHLIDYWDQPNVFAVGDDDQCIYEFQGARMQNILDFHSRYQSDMEVVVLEDNYRSTQAILDCSTQLINCNKDRLVTQVPGLTKSLHAKKEPYTSSDVVPSIIQYPNSKHEELGIVSKIESLMLQGVPLNEVAIIYLKHKQGEEVISLMEKKGIPYNVIKKTNILQLPLINNLINILYCIQLEAKRPYSGDYLLFEIMHYRFFGLRPRDIARLAAYRSRNRGLHLRDLAGDPKLLSEILPDNKDQFTAFAEMLDAWITEAHNNTLQKVVEKVINSSGLLREVINAPDKTWQMQVLTTFFDFIKEESLKNPLITLSHFLDTLDKMKEHKIPLSINKTVFEEEGVNCTTAHSAKGLEFEYVFFMGCTHNEWGKKGGNQYTYSLPDTITGSVEENELESLRRVFYVAITRAKQYLEISFPEYTNAGKKLEKSNFVAEIENEDLLSQEKRKMDTDLFTQLSLEQLVEPRISKEQFPEEDFINSLLEKYSMSVTHLNKYLNCPVSFYYESILRVPSAKNDSMAFGTAVHFALKRLFDKMLENEDKSFPNAKEFMEDFMWELERHRASFSAEQFTRRKELAEEIIPSYYDKYKDKWNKVVLCEYSIKEVEMDGIPLNGKLDKLEFDKRNVNVVDYKTGKVAKGKKKLQRPSEKNPKGGEYWRQIVFYKILMDEVRPRQWTMISGEIDFIEKGEKDFEKILLTVSHEDIVIVKEQIRQVYDSIMNHDFSEGCGKDDCHWCNFVKNEFVSDATIGVNEEFEA